jgi:hypothetical protein
LFNLFNLLLHLKTISTTELISNINVSNVTQSSKFIRTTEMFMTDSVFLFFQLNVTARRSVPMLGLNHWTPLINTGNKIENYSYDNHTTILHVCTYLFIRIKISRYGFTFKQNAVFEFAISDEGGPNGLMSTRSSKQSLSPADFRFLMDTTEFIGVVATLTYTLH